MTNFKDLELDPDVLKAVEEAGYETPTPIQAEAIPFALTGRDVLGIAQTGTGKTASFTLPMITMLAKGRARARMPRSLVLAPTRELAAQVAENFETYAKYKKLTMALLIGGVSFKDQERLIDRGADVLIATPGRLLDHFERGKLMLTGIEIMVVDEADRMLDMGFIPDIERIFKLTPFTRQTLFFSATMAPEITRITQEFLHNPERVEVARQATASETIEQAVCMFRASKREQAAKDKREILRRLIRGEGDSLTNGGDLDQSLRTKTLQGFRDGDLKLLIASDVAARGLDIPDVSHVYNFDVPIHSEDYVHRIGRTGRAGRSGKAITICSSADEKYWGKVEELIGQEIKRLENPLKNGSAEEPQAEKPKSRSRSKPKPEEAKAKSEAPKEASEAPAKRPRSRGGRKDNENQQDRPQGRRGYKQEPRNTIVGMGDHVPDFLTRDFRKTTAEAVEDTAVSDSQ